MCVHIVTSTFFNFDEFAARASQGEGPRHTVAQLASYLDAKIHQPDSRKITLFHRVMSAFYAAPEQWVVAQKLSKEVKDGDTVFCCGQDVGLILALYFCFPRSKIKLAVSVMEPTLPRFRLLMKLFQLDRLIDLYVVNDKQKKNILECTFKIHSSKIFTVPEQTDAQFFTPPPPPGDSRDIDRKRRPLIASAGREQRDYKTLADAVSSMDIDIEICAVSPNASKKQKISMPSVVPDNMHFHDYSFKDLKQLYQRADIVIVSMLENKSSAGLTVLMEAIASKIPVIITINEGLSKKFVESGLAVGVAPADFIAMREAIKYLLDNPSEMDKMASLAFDYFLKNHTSDHYVDVLSSVLKSLDK